VTDLVPIAGKLAPLIRRLGSDQDGEILAVVHALIRTLKSAGTDLHALADHIEHPGELDEGEAQAIYDAGVKRGIALGEQQARHKAQSNGSNGAQLPAAVAMADYCHQRRDNHRLRDKDREFIDHMVRVAQRRGLSPKQQTWLEDLYLKLGGT
jgi:hypothetical protein